MIHRVPLYPHIERKTNTTTTPTNKSVSQFTVKHNCKVTMFNVICCKLFVCGGVLVHLIIGVLRVGGGGEACPDCPPGKASPLGRARPTLQRGMTRRRCATALRARSLTSLRSRCRPRRWRTWPRREHVQGTHFCFVVLLFVKRCFRLVRAIFCCALFCSRLYRALTSFVFLFWCHVSPRVPIPSKQNTQRSRNPVTKVHSGLKQD